MGAILALSQLSLRRRYKRNPTAPSRSAIKGRHTPNAIHSAVRSSPSSLELWDELCLA